MPAAIASQLRQYSDRGPVLIVDRPRNIAGTVTPLLNECGLDVRWVTDTTQAWAALEKERCLAMLTSLVALQPDDGVTLIRRAAERWPRLPIIAMSHNHDRLMDALYAGAVQQLGKPFGERELLIKLDLAVRHHRT